MDFTAGQRCWPGQRQGAAPGLGPLQGGGCVPSAPFLLPTTTDPEYWKPSGNLGETTQQSHFSASNMDHRACTDPTSWLPIGGKKWASWATRGQQKQPLVRPALLGFRLFVYFPHCVISSLAAQCFEGASVSSATEQAIYNCLVPKADFLSFCDVPGPCRYFHV